jgi:hypothetical protein
VLTRVLGDAEAKLERDRHAADEVAWKNSFHQEQAENEKLSRKLKDSDVQYREALSLNRDVGEALEPLLETFVPVDPAVDPPPSFLTRVGELGDGINEYLRGAIRQAVGQVFASVRAFHPALDLRPVAEVIPSECSPEEYQSHVEELAPVAAKYLEKISSAGDDSQ